MFLLTLPDKNESVFVFVFAHYVLVTITIISCTNIPVVVISTIIWSLNIFVIMIDMIMVRIIGEVIHVQLQGYTFASF